MDVSAAVHPLWRSADGRYLYTTMSDEGLEANIDASDFKAPMAGFGYGLPLSRLVSEHRALGVWADRRSMRVSSAVICG